MKRMQVAGSFSHCPAAWLLLWLAGKAAQLPRRALTTPRRHSWPCSTARAIDSQSSDAGAYDPVCPGRLRGGQILYPTVYRKAATKYFPAVADTPCAAKA